MTKKSLLLSVLIFSIFSFSFLFSAYSKAMIGEGLWRIPFILIGIPPSVAATIVSTYYCDFAGINFSECSPYIDYFLYFFFSLLVSLLPLFLSIIKSRKRLAK